MQNNITTEGKKVQQEERILISNPLSLKRNGNLFFCSNVSILSKKQAR